MQRINRILMMRARNLVGPFFQRIGSNTYVRSAGNYIGSNPAGPTLLTDGDGNVLVDGDGAAYTM